MSFDLTSSCNNSVVASRIASLELYSAVVAPLIPLHVDTNSPLFVYQIL